MTSLAVLALQDKDLMALVMAADTREQASIGHTDYTPPSGLGVLHCRRCGRPYRDHPIAQPCRFGVRS